MHVVSARNGWVVQFCSSPKLIVLEKGEMNNTFEIFKTRVTLYMRMISMISNGQRMYLVMLQ